jgi:hypothetical protein
MGGGSVVGSVVTLKAKTASAGKNSSSGLHGVNINVGYPNNKTYIYVNGDVNMASGTIGGLSMIVSMGSVNLHGTQSSAIIIANGNIEAASGSVAACTPTDRSIFMAQTLPIPHRLFQNSSPKHR